MTTILDITDMASRNVKVAWDLFPSAFSGYLMQEGKPRYSLQLEV